jgi:hypothetical protein
MRTTYSSMCQPRQRDCLHANGTRSAGAGEIPEREPVSIAIGRVRAVRRALPSPSVKVFGNGFLPPSPPAEPAEACEQQAG